MHSLKLCCSITEMNAPQPHHHTPLESYDHMRHLVKHIQYDLLCLQLDYMKCSCLFCECVSPALTDITVTSKTTDPRAQAVILWLTQRKFSCYHFILTLFNVKQSVNTMDQNGDVSTLKTEISAYQCGQYQARGLCGPLNLSLRRSL